MIEQGIDVAMQLGEPQDPRLVAHSLCPIRYALCAAPQYLRRHGTPKTIAELSTHRCLTFIEPRTETQREWMLAKKNKNVAVKPRGAINIDDVHALLDIVLAGEGIAYIMEFMIKDSIAAGRLKTIMPQFGYDGPTAYIVHPPTRFQSGSVRAFIEFLRGLAPVPQRGGRLRVVSAAD
jgi:DNA-binding transcriptional LysR family regulator